MTVLATVTGCGLTSYDNYEKPEAVLSGAIVHEGDTIRVRSGAAELELWEPGFELNTKIPVSISKDGTFSAKLFEGSYKLTQLIGDGPWVPSTDTMAVEVNGDKQIQFEVEPYYKITSSDIALEGSEITADFTLEQVNGSRDISFVTLFLGTGKFTSIRHNSFFWNQYQEGIQIDDNGPNSMSISLSQLPDNLAGRDYVFARICVEIIGKEDALYSKVYKISLQ